MNTYIRLEKPYEWVRLNEQKVDAFGEVDSLAAYPDMQEHEVIGVVPGQWVTMHKVDIPAKTKKQFNAALPYTLEESISDDIEYTHFVCSKWEGAGQSNVFVVSKQKMRSWQALANQYKLPVERLIPDYSLLPYHEAADCSIGLVDDQVLANHKDGFGVSLDPDFLDLWIKDVPLKSTIAVNDQALTDRLIEAHPDRDFRHWPFGAKMAHWLEYPNQPDYDLWSDEFRPSVNHFRWQLLAIPAAILLFSTFLLMLYDAYRYLALHSEIASIKKEMQQVVKKAIPELQGAEISDPKMILEQGLKRGINQQVYSDTVQGLLASVAKAVRGQNIVIDHFVFRDSRLEVSLKVSDFAQLDRVTKKINAVAGVKAELKASSAKDKIILADFVVSVGG